jgi:hypothetical protein
MVPACHEVTGNRIGQPPPDTVTSPKVWEAALVAARRAEQLADRRRARREPGLTRGARTSDFDLQT